MKSAANVDEYIDSKPAWTEALMLLRDLALATGLKETIKWGMPVYCLGRKNVAGVAAFKHHVAIWFYQGVFLEDRAGKLVSSEEGAARAMRQWRFGHAGEIRENTALIGDYLQEATRNQEQGKELKPEKGRPLVIPPELQEALAEDPLLQAAFKSLSLSKRRQYADHVAGAKQEETRISRLHKVVPLIKAGHGLYDKYN